MKKSVILLLFITIFMSCFSQQKGDSLAILYHRVYAYKIPSDLGTRFSKIPFSYLDKNKLVFIAKSENHPKYFQVKTVKGDTVFVKQKLVYYDQKLTHAQIEQDVEDGIRKTAFVIAIFYESISNFGIKTGIIGSFVYVLLMLLYFYAGYIAGLFLVAVIAIFILIYFFRYFKKMFI